MNDFCILVIPYGNDVSGVMENFDSSGLFNSDFGSRFVQSITQHG
ncbi:putative tail protein [Salmonella phage 41]|nr:putative tail protein [Salmonella phage 41]